MKKFKITVLSNNKSTHFTITSSDFGEALAKAEIKLKKEKKDWDEIDVHPEDWEPSEEIKEQLKNWPVTKEKLNVNEIRVLW